MEGTWDFRRISQRTINASYCTYLKRRCLKPTFVNPNITDRFQIDSLQLRCWRKGQEERRTGPSDPDTGRQGHSLGSSFWIGLNVRNAYENDAFDVVRIEVCVNDDAFDDMRVEVCVNYDAEEAEAGRLLISKQQVLR